MISKECYFQITKDFLNRKLKHIDESFNDNKTVTTETEDDDDEGSTNDDSTSRRIFKCPFSQCLKFYHSNENLMIHIKNKHLNIKPFKCSFCNFSYSHRYGKIYHERAYHLFYFPYKCSVIGCKAKFACKSSLTTHMKKHMTIIT